MQHKYAYNCVVPIGKEFDPEFRPQLSPKEMLALGVFGGVYMRDCKDEFPKDWYKKCKVCTGRYKKTHLFLELFWKECQPATISMEEKRMDIQRGSTWMVPMVLPILYGSEAP